MTAADIRVVQDSFTIPPVPGAYFTKWLTCPAEKPYAVSGGYSISPANQAETLTVYSVGPNNSSAYPPFSALAPTSWSVSVMPKAGAPEFSLTIYVTCSS